MEIIKIAAVAILGTCIATLLKEQKPVFGIVTAMAITGVLLAFLVPFFWEFTDYIRRMYRMTEGNQPYISGLLKITGITCITHIAECVCKDAGISSAAFVVTLAGKLMCVCLCLPTVSAIFSLLTELLPGG